MIKLIFTLLLLTGTLCVYAQQSPLEKTIRQLEEAEHQAVLKRDTAALRDIWSDELIVNAPSNRVVRSGKTVGERPVVARLSYSSFTREIEQILIKGDIVISMGSEVVVPIGDVPKAGQAIKRRYTNIWRNENGTWKLAARHANEICQ